MTEKAPLPKHIGDRNSRDFTLTALVELPIRAAGYFLFQRTGDLFWLIGAQAIGAAILLAVFLRVNRRVKQYREEIQDAF